MKPHYAFTMIELLIAIAIVGILTAIAIPSYQNYLRRARYSEIVHAAAPYKLGVAECYQTTASLSDCNPGKNGVPEDVSQGEGAGIVDSIKVETNGKIVVSPIEKYGFKETDSYELIPTIVNDRLTWQASGGGVEAGYAR